MNPFVQDRIYKTVTDRIKENLKAIDLSLLATPSPTDIYGLKIEVCDQFNLPFHRINITTETALHEKKRKYYAPSSAVFIDFNEKDFNPFDLPDSPPLPEQQSADRRPGRPKGSTKARIEALLKAERERFLSLNPLAPKWIVLMNTYRYYDHLHFEITENDMVFIQSERKPDMVLCGRCIHTLTLGKYHLPLLKVEGSLPYTMPNLIQQVVPKKTA